MRVGASSRSSFPRSPGWNRRLLLVFAGLAYSSSALAQNAGGTGGIDAYGDSGASGGVGSVGEVRRSTVTINLVPRAERNLSQQAFESSIGRQLSVIPGVRTRLGEDGSSSAKIQVSLLSDDAAALADAARLLAHDMCTHSGIPPRESDEQLREA